MIRFLFLCFAAIGTLTTAVASEEVVLGLSQNRVAITADFDGSEILVFGAIKREKPIPPGDPIGVVVTVEGPPQPVTVRRKERKYGIWINTDSVEIDSAPTFYAVATNGPFSDVMNHTEDLRHHVSVRQAIRAVGAPSNVVDAGEFKKAVIRIRRNNDLYQLLENTVEVTAQTLFKTSISLPSNLTEGSYQTRIFLTRNGKVISHHETAIDVRKVGLERFLFNLSREQPLIYGLMSLAIAIIAGWGASAVFQIFRRT